MQTAVPVATPVAEKPEPLIPEFLTGSLAYFFLWAVPVAILLGLNASSYSLIESSMNATQRAAAHALGWTEVGNLTVSVLFGLALYLRQRSAGPDTQDAR